MPDAPDWYNYQREGVRHVQTDVAELAARLDSPSRYDRRGQVIWWDDFRFDLSPWIISGSGTGNGVATITTPTFWGPKTCEMTAGSDAALSSALIKYIGPVERSTIGVELAVAFRSDFSFFQLLIQRFDGVGRDIGQIMIHRVIGTIFIVTGTMGPITLRTIAALDNPFGIYHHLKLVVDFENNMYLRAQYNDMEWDLSQYDLRRLVAPDIEQYRTNINHVGRAGFNDVALLGYCIVTSGEP